MEAPASLLRILYVLPVSIAVFLRSFDQEEFVVFYSIHGRERAVPFVCISIGREPGGRFAGTCIFAF